MLPPEINFISKEKKLDTLSEFLSFNLKEARDKLRRQQDLFEQKESSQEALDSAETIFKLTNL